MLPGPSYVYECQSCSGLFVRRSISSGNTSRAKFRSDGQMSAPMLPITPLLVACPHCKSSIFWPTAKEVDSYETYDLTGIFDVGEMLPENSVGSAPMMNEVRVAVLNWSSMSKRTCKNCCC
jgi:hypothetical protein